MAIYKRAGTRMYWTCFSVAGQLYRMSLGTSDRREALSKEKDAIRKACEGKLAKPGAPFQRLCFTEAVDQYVADRTAHIEPKTNRTEIERAKALKAKLGALVLRKISAETVRAYMRDR